MTSRSRSVSKSRPAGGAMLVISGRVANRSSSRLVTDGASSASPAVTTRMPAMMSAGGASLSRNPLAPADSAPTTYSSRSKSGEHDHLGPPVWPGSSADATGGLDPVHPPHPDCHQPAVRLDPLGP